MWELSIIQQMMKKAYSRKCLDWIHDCFFFFHFSLYIWDTLAEGQTLLISKPQQRDQKPHMPQFKVRKHQSLRVTARMSLTRTEVSSRHAVCPLYHESAAIFECDNMMQLPAQNSVAAERLRCEFRSPRKCFIFCCTESPPHDLIMTCFLKSDLNILKHVQE